MDAADDVFEAIEPGDQGDDVIRRGDRNSDLVPGHDRDVIDRQDVGGVGHGDQQGALVGERHRHRLVTLGDRCRDQVGCRHVDLEDAQVEVVEAVALSQRPGEPVGRDGALVQQDPLWRTAGVSRGLDRVLDLALGCQLHGHDHIGQKARR